MNKFNYDIKDIYEWPIKAQMTLLILAAVVIFYFAYLFGFISLGKEIHGGFLSEQDLKKQFKLLVDKEIVANSNIAKIPALKKTLAIWQNNIISKSEITGLLDQILKLGSSVGLQFNLFEPGNEIKDGVYTKIPVKINAIGTYNQIASFFSQIANMPKLVVINDFTLSKDILGQIIQAAPVTTQAYNAVQGPDTILGTQINLDVYRK